MKAFLADTGGSFDFGSFQRGFHDVWEFFFPNALMLVLSIFIARFVGRISLPWLRVPWDRLQHGLRQVSAFLEESHLFGSKLLPAVVLVAAVIAVLDVFQIFRMAAHQLLPPTIVTMPNDLYARLAADDLLLEMALKDKSLRHEYDLYDRIHARSQDLEAAQNANRGVLDYWREVRGKWWSYAGDLKLLSAVALVSCIAGLVRGHWRSPLRLLLVLVPLSVGFLFCIAKHLYAHEQQAYVVLRVVGEEIRAQPLPTGDGGSLPDIAALRNTRPWLTAPRPPLGRWWELQWINLNFFKRGAALLGLTETERGGERPPLIQQQHVEDAPPPE